jgi:hypothetical protein
MIYHHTFQMHAWYWLWLFLVHVNILFFTRYAWCQPFLRCCLWNSSWNIQFIKQITKPFFMCRTHCLFWDISARFAKQDLFSRWNSFLSRNIFIERLTIWLIDWFLMFNVTFSNISAISWRPVLVVEEARVPGENHRPWASNW